MHKCYVQYFVSYSDGAALFTSRLYYSARRPFIMYNEVAMMITVSVATVEEYVVAHSQECILLRHYGV